MHRDWLAMEHYRMHVMEQWPDSPRKAAGLAAVRSTIESLQKTAPADAAEFVCCDCLGQRVRPNVIQFPASVAPPASQRLAA